MPDGNPEVGVHIGGDFAEFETALNHFIEQASQGMAKLAQAGTVSPEALGGQFAGLQKELEQQVKLKVELPPEGRSRIVAEIRAAVKQGFTEALLSETSETGLGARARGAFNQLRQTITGKTPDVGYNVRAREAFDRAQPSSVIAPRDQYTAERANIKALEDQLAGLKRRRAFDETLEGLGKDSVTLQGKINAEQREYAVGVAAKRAEFLRQAPGGIEGLAGKQAQADLFEREFQSRTRNAVAVAEYADPDRAAREGQTAALDRLSNLKKLVEQEHVLQASAEEDVKLYAEEVQLRRVRNAREKAAASDFTARPEVGAEIAAAEARTRFNERQQGALRSSAESSLYLPGGDAQQTAEAQAAVEREAKAKLDEKLASLTQSLEYQKQYGVFLQENVGALAQESLLRKANNAELTRIEAEAKAGEGPVAAKLREDEVATQLAKERNKVLTDQLALEARGGQTAVSRTAATSAGAQEQATLQRRLLVANQTLNRATEESVLVGDRVRLAAEVKVAEQDLAKKIRREAESIQGNAPGKAGVFQQLYAKAKGVEDPTEVPSLGNFIGTRALSTAAYGASAALLYGGVTQIKTLITSAEDFERVMADVQVQFQSLGKSDQLDGFRDSMLQIARSTGQAGSEVLKVGAEFESAFGGNTQRAVTETAAAFEAVRVSGFKIEDLNNIFTTLVENFDAAGVSIQALEDKAIGLQERFGTASKDTVNFAAALAPVGADANFTAAQLESLGAVASKFSARSPQILAESFNRILPAIQAKSLELTNVFATTPAVVGDLQKVEAAFKSGDIESFFEVLLRDWPKLDKQTQDYVVTQLAMKRDQASLIAVLNNGTDALKEFGNAHDDAGKLAARNAALQETLTERVKRLGEELRQVGVDAFEGGLGDFFKELVGAVEELLSSAREVAHLFSELNDLSGGSLGETLKLLIEYAAVSKTVSLVSAGLSAVGSVVGSVKPLGQSRSINDILGISAKDKDLSGTAKVAKTEGELTTVRVEGAQAAIKVETQLAELRGVSATEAEAAGTAEADLGTKREAGVAATTAAAAGDTTLAEVRTAEAVATDVAVKSEEELTTTREVPGGGGLAGAAGAASLVGLLALLQLSQVKGPTGLPWDQSQQVTGADFSQTGRYKDYQLTQFLSSTAINSDSLTSADDYQRYVSEAKAGRLTGTSGNALTGGRITMPIETPQALNDTLSANALGGASWSQRIAYNVQKTPWVGGAFSHLGFGDQTVQNNLNAIHAAGGEDLTRRLDGIKKFAANNQEIAAVAEIEAKKQGSSVADATKEIQDSLANVLGQDGGATASYQEIDALKALVGKWVPEANKAIAKKAQDAANKTYQESKVLESASQAKSDYESGAITLGEYSDKLQAVIQQMQKSGYDTSGDQSKVDKITAARKEYDDLLTTALKKQTDSLVSFDKLRGDPQSDRYAADQYIALLKTNKLNPTDELAFTQKATDALIAAHQRDIAMAKTASEKAKLQAEGIKVPPELQAYLDSDNLKTANVQFEDYSSKLFSGDVAPQQAAGKYSATGDLLHGNFKLTQGATYNQAKDILNKIGLNQNDFADEVGKIMADTNATVSEATEIVLKDAKAKVDKAIDVIEHEGLFKHVADEKKLGDLRIAQQYLDQAIKSVPSGLGASSDLGTIGQDQAAADATIAENAKKQSDAKFAYARSLANGDPIKLATLAKQQAEEALGLAIKGTPEYTTALAQIQDADNQMAQAVLTQQQGWMNYWLAVANNDPLAAAQNALKVANDALAKANPSDTNYGQLLANQLTAQHAANKAQQDSADSTDAVAESLQRYHGDELGALKKQLDDLQARRNRTDIGLNDEDRKQLDVQINQLKGQVRDTGLSNQRGLIDYQLQMGQITKGQAIAFMQGLLQTKDINDAQVRDINLAIKNLRSQLGADTQFNLPSRLGLPTLYEVRRITQTPGGAGGYQDNRVVTVTVNANTGASAQDIANAVNGVVGQPNRYGTRIGAY